MLDETAMANGFANRFLFACVKRSKAAAVRRRACPGGGRSDWASRSKDSNSWRRNARQP